MIFNSLILGKRELNETLSTFSFVRPATFDFKAGQFLIISFNSNFSESHPFSISSSPLDGVLEISTRKLGPFTTKLHSAPLGSNMWIKGPYGVFTIQDSKSEIILIAGGVGITPFLSMLRYETHSKLKRDITLVYSVRETGDFLEKKTLEKLAISNKRLHLMYLISGEAPQGWDGLVGRVDKNFLSQKFTSFSDKIVYLCGPPPMVASLKEALASLGLPNENLHIDNWEFAKQVSSGIVKD